MDELIKQLTRAAKAVADYYENQSAGVAALPFAGGVSPAEVNPVAVKRGRKSKAQVVEATMPVADNADEPLAPAADEVSEEDSLREIKALAKTYVQRFQNQVDGVMAFRKLMSDTCRVGKLDDLVHAQRLQMIQAMKAEIVKADAKKPAMASGVEV